MEAREKAAISRRLLLWKLYFYFLALFINVQPSWALRQKTEGRKNRKRENINRFPKTENDPMLTATGQHSRQQIIS